MEGGGSEEGSPHSESCFPSQRREKAFIMAIPMRGMAGLREDGKK